MASSAMAGVPDSVVAEKSVQEQILGEIRANLDVKSRAFDSTIGKLDNRVGRIDSLIRTTGNPKERIDKLVERVQILEQKQKALEENELAVYEANYQSAMINLVSMDREIKPLILFHTTREFFNSLTATSDPDNYRDFTAGYQHFKEYVDKFKDYSATLKAISGVVNATGTESASIPIVGAYSQLMFSGMAEYVNTIGHKKRDLKIEAEKMFAVTASLSQFTSDKNLVENEWEGITESLQEMQVYYDTVMNRNLRMLGIDRADVTAGFSRQSDAGKRYQYLTMLRQRAADYVQQLKKDDPKNWKESIYYQLMDAQSSKVRYGEITNRILHHINKYSALIARYKDNKEIGEHVARLQEKLDQLKATFDDTFEPAQYVHAATQMYKVM